MKNTETKARRSKISHEFALRIDNLEADEAVRAIVLLNIRGNNEFKGKRQDRAQRQLAVEGMHKAGMDALGEIEGILKEFHGKLLSEHPDALGSIHVEATADGIRALAESDWVKTIFEDQKIHPRFC